MQSFQQTFSWIYVSTSQRPIERSVYIRSLFKPISNSSQIHFIHLNTIIFRKKLWACLFFRLFSRKCITISFLSSEIFLALNNIQEVEIRKNQSLNIKTAFYFFTYNFRYSIPFIARLVKNDLRIEMLCCSWNLLAYFTRSQAISLAASCYLDTFTYLNHCFPFTAENCLYDLLDRHDQKTASFI